MNFLNDHFPFASSKKSQQGGGAEHQADKLFKRTWILRLKFSQMIIYFFGI